VAADRIPGWPELVVRMQLAEPPPLRATVLLRDRREGRRGPEERIERVAFRPPDHARVEDAAGRPTRIRAPGVMWFVRDGVAEMSPRAAESDGWHHPLLRPAAAPGAFTDRRGLHRVVDGPHRETVLGRTAWRVTLAPTPHKPRPVTLWIDDEHGFLLRAEARAEGSPDPVHLIALTELELGATLDDSLFTWEGPVDDTWVRERERRRRAQEAYSRRPPQVPRYWPTGVRYDLRDGDPSTGSWTVDLDVAGRSDPERPSWARLDRRPLGAPAYDGAEGHVHRWSDDRWQWTLECGEALSEDELASVIASIPAD
jgi:hypothetical protein